MARKTRKRKVSQAGLGQGPETRTAKRHKQQHQEQEITQEFLAAAQEAFEEDQTNTLARNAVVNVGAFNAALDPAETNKINHIFLNSLKPDRIRATDQEHSGRCWMFAGLNVFRYFLIKALDLETFEFSETYLFFYDKLERANYFLQYFVDHPDGLEEEDQLEARRAYEMRKTYLGDGGYWSYFANLVKKYGLVPKEVMEETYLSGWTDEMNEILEERLVSCVNHMNRLWKAGGAESVSEIQEAKDHTMKQVYNCLVKFLGQPPQDFVWYYKTTNEEKQAVQATPATFREMALGGTTPDDFVLLGHAPGRPYRQMIQIRNANNIVGQEDEKILNLPIEELKEYAMKSILAGIPVWFAGDVGKGFVPHRAALGEEFYDTNLLFGEPFEWTKTEKMRNLWTQGNHAMTLTGVNADEPMTWQVENSWGYYDREMPGMDGFMMMTDKWFEDNVVQIVIHREFLDRRTKRLLKQPPIVLEPWEGMAPAFRVLSHKPHKPWGRD